MTRDALRLALQAHVDPRSAAKAIKLGARAVRGLAGERIEAAARELGIKLPE